MYFSVADRTSLHQRVLLGSRLVLLRRRVPAVIVVRLRDARHQREIETMSCREQRECASGLPKPAVFMNSLLTRLLMRVFE